MASLRARIGLAVVGLVAIEGVAAANPGINAYSGKPDQFQPGMTCDSTCHKANQPIPTLDITIPSSVTAGSTNEVTIVINGTRARTSLDAAFSDGVKAVEGQNTDVPFPVESPGEVVAVVPPPAGKNGTYRFSFVAPSTNGAITLWVAAMSASGSGSGNDGVAKTTRTIQVTGGSAATDGGITPSPDAGSSSRDGGTPSSDASPGSNPDPEDDDENSATAPRPDANEAGSCAMSSRPRRHGASVLVLFAVGIAGLATRRRRYSPPLR